MYSSVACTCMRYGAKISAAKLSTFSSSCMTYKILSGGLSLALRRSGFLHTAQNRLCLRSKSVSGSTRQYTETVGSFPSLPEQESFGSLSEDIASRRNYKKSSPDIRDVSRQEDVSREEDETERMGRPHRRNTPYWYFIQCKKLIKANKLQEALDVFSRDMLQGERLQPEEFNYSVLIGGCGRAGQLKKAFKLYNDMKKRGLEASDATYTALFNACAESPSKQDGLQQALRLEQELRRKHVPLSTITYHALLKTHARTNHLHACLHIIREMLQNGHTVTQETFHYLLMGCLRNKEAGFTLALQVWRQMLRSGIEPDSKNYNLLLRTARDCGIGDPALASNTLLSSDTKESKEKEAVPGSICNRVIDIDLLEKQLFISQVPDTEARLRTKLCKEEEATQLKPVRGTENIPVPFQLENEAAGLNLLDLFEGKRLAVLSLGAVDTASDRLALIGGATGFLQKMEATGLTPDLKTLTLLADTAEPSLQALQVLLRAAKRHQVKLDVAFFNSMIRRAVRANKLEDAKGVLGVMRQRNVNVNIQTFGCLALGCGVQKEGLQLLKDIEAAGLRPNVHVFSALIGRATQRLDYVYLKTLLKTMKDMNVWPNEVIIRQLEFASQYPPNYNQYKTRNNYLVHINGFRGYYQQWLRELPAQDAAEEQPELHAGVDGAEAGRGGAADGLTEAQRNQRAAARRFNSRHSEKLSATGSSQ